MKKEIFLLVALLISGLFQSRGQDNPSIIFSQTVVDLGDVEEGKGLINHRFNFVNQSREPIQIENVTASCGCTSPHWTVETIPSGASGYIDVHFDPQNRPGPFDKSLQVNYQGQTLHSDLRIKGFVLSAPASIEEEFPVDLGDLRLKNRFLDLGNIKTGRLFSKSFEMYNNSPNILVFADEMEGPDHITVTYEPYTLKPHSRGKLWVHYDVDAKKDLGYFREDISLFTYEQAVPRKDLAVTCTILDIPDQNDANQARVFFPETIQDFGIRQQGDTVVVTYVMKNIGSSPLLVKKTLSSCNCMRIQLEKSKLDPGGSTTLKTIFLTHQRVGNQQKSITIFTSDPAQPVSVLTLKGLLRGPRD